MGAFLYPLFLWAGIAVLVPLLLHLIERLRVVRIPFSTIRFLTLAKKKSARRTILENLTLLALRMLLVLLIASAFAMPVVRARAFRGALGRPDRDIAIVIDGSYSMRYRTGNRAIWDDATETAVALVEGLGGRDRVSIFVAQDEVRPLVQQLTADRKFAVNQIRGLNPVPTGSQLLPAIDAARESLRHGAGNREREVHVITDGQALPWSRSETSATARSAPGFDDKSAAFFVTLLGALSPENVAVRDVQLTPPLIMPNTQCRATVTLTRVGPIKTDAISLFVDDKEIARRGGSPSDGEEGIVFSLPPLVSGAHAARVEIPADNLTEDNTFHFLIRVEGSLPVLCVGPDESTFYLAKALNPGNEPDSATRIKRTGASGLMNEDLGAYSCVFLCNALPLPGEAIVRVEQYVNAGGCLALFPGDAANVKDYRTWQCLPAFPADVEEVPVHLRRKTLRLEKPRHPLLSALNPGARGPPVLTIARQLRIKNLEKTAESLISSGAENPFLSRRSFGNGQALMFSVSADRSWGNFPLSPFFLPVVHQLVQFAVRKEARTPYLWASRSASLSEHLPARIEGRVLTDPGNNPVPIRASTVENRVSLRADNLMLPGIYLLSNPRGGGTEPALAVNSDRDESDLTPVKRDEIPGIMGVERVKLAAGREELASLMEQHRVGRTFGEELLWLVLVVAVVELVYSNRRARSGASFAGSPRIGAAGRLSKGS